MLPCKVCLGFCRPAVTSGRSVLHQNSPCLLFWVEVRHILFETRMICSKKSSTFTIRKCHLYLFSIYFFNLVSKYYHQFQLLLEEALITFRMILFLVHCKHFQAMCIFLWWSDGWSYFVFNGNLRQLNCFFTSTLTKAVKSFKIVCLAS